MTCHVSPWSTRSSAPASSASIISSSSSAVLATTIDALALELPRHRPRLRARPAVLGEDGAHVGAGAVAVVGERLHVDGHAARGVALVVDGLVVDPLEAAGGPLDGPLDGVGGHRRLPGLGVHGAQGGVGRHVGPALARRHLDLAQDLGEDLGPHLVLGALLVLDGGPLGMAGHGTSSGPAQEVLVQAQVARQLGMEGGHEDVALAAEDGLAVDAWPGPRRPRPPARRPAPG